MAEKKRSMGVAVMGPMRSGTTLVADLLTVRGRSLVISEPNLLGVWHPNATLAIHRLVTEFGIDVPPPPTVKPPARIFNYFDRVILPELQGLDFWGVKYVDLYGWPQLFQRYRPRKLILCVRDLREVAVSAIELTERMKLGFPGGAHMRDVAWVLSRLAHTVHELLALRRLPHFVLRYEDLVEDPKVRERLADYVGLDELGTERLNLTIERDSRQSWESRKHGGGVTKKALGRFEREPPGPVRSLAERVWRLLGEYSVAFDYEVAEPKARIHGHDFSAPARPGRNPVPYDKAETWNWKGPRQFEPSFARRRARRLASQNIPAGAVVLDLGGGLSSMITELPMGSRLIHADVIERTPQTKAADLLHGRLPPKGTATFVLALDILEQVEQPGRFLKALRGYGLPVLLSYHATDDTADLDREALGWRSHLSREQLSRGLATVGFKVTTSWAFDGRQSLLKLRPVPVPARAPRAKAEDRA
jgi:hypothetical protein